MARDTLTDKELLLKKAARRRLVGAVTLVVLMLILMPFVLKDRVAEMAQQQVQITVIPQAQSPAPLLELPETVITTSDVPSQLPAPSEGTEPASSETAIIAEPSASANHQHASDGSTDTTVTVTPPVTHDKPDVNAGGSAKAQTEPTLDKKSASQLAQRAANTHESTSTAQKNLESKTAVSKPVEQHAETPAVTKPHAFYVQFGVFSDKKNSASLQQRLKHAGIAASSEALENNAQKFRLRSSLFASRNEAQALLKKAQAAGFNGMVAHKS